MLLMLLFWGHIFKKQQYIGGGYPSGSDGKESTQARSLGQENPLEKWMAHQSSIPTWRIPWTEECGGLQSMGLQSGTWLSDWCMHSTLELVSEVNLV